jgi:hypothetical protein
VKQNQELFGKCSLQEKNFLPMFWWFVADTG